MAGTGRPSCAPVSTSTVSLEGEGAVLERVHSLHASGVTLYLWSSGGAAYARTTAEELGIADCFVGFLAKPTHIVDDQHITEWRDLKHLHPNENIST